MPDPHKPSLIWLQEPLRSKTSYQRRVVKNLRVGPTDNSEKPARAAAFARAASRSSNATAHSIPGSAPIAACLILHSPPPAQHEGLPRSAAAGARVQAARADQPH